MPWIVLLVFPLLFVTLLVLAWIYCLFVSAVVYAGLLRDREHGCVVASGRRHAILCCTVAQRTLHMFGAYDLIMNRLARRRRTVESKSGQVCFFGDSGFALWSGMSRTMRENGVDGFNVAFGGSTSKQCVRHLRELVVDRMPVLTAVHVGSNDYEIGEKVDDVARRIRYIQRAVPAVFVLGPRKPAYTDEKWKFMTQLASRCKPTLDLSDAKLVYTTDGLHPTSASLDAELAPRLARGLLKRLGRSRPAQ